MALSWNEIRRKAIEFGNYWKDVERERAEAQTFWNEFFDVFGITRKRVASFEEPVKKVAEAQGFIDCFWKGLLITEHKSKGKNLDSAYEQALGYFHGLKEEELPKYVIVTDFEKIRLYDLEESNTHEFYVQKLHENIRLFSFIAGYTKTSFKPEDPVNIKAAELMGGLHDSLFESGYIGHKLEVFLVRILFCLFADDTGIFEKGIFADYLINRTKQDGSDIGPLLAQLFEVLNTPEDKRHKTLDEDLALFPYVNGKLYEEILPMSSFDSGMRDALLRCSSFDWSKISPAVFGSLFQSVMDKDIRRNLGAHYTTEENILKLIHPLFLDELWEEYESIKTNKVKLNLFHIKLSKLKFLDPACGCGNFLVITYRELRLLEIEVLKSLFKKQKTLFEINQIVKLDVDNFYGIEIEEFPARIAEVAMWLVDHQMNVLVSEEFGQYLGRLPLKKSANIVNGNALQLDWEEVASKNKLSYILGNPPFVGAKFMTDENRKDIENVSSGLKNYGLLDFVSGWYFKATQFIQNSSIRVAFVSTNSITQGEQVGVLWDWMLSKGIKINFAHRTFQWSSEARGKAAVHVVIIGFANFDTTNKYLFEYENIKSEPHKVKVKNINPYLVDAIDIVVKRRETPICKVPSMGIGNKPIDGGYYLFTPEEKINFLKETPDAQKYFYRWMGAVEFINDIERWFLWLGNIEPSELRKMPAVMDRIEKVRKIRLDSKSMPTKKLAETPTKLHVENIPDKPYLVIPEVSSERRQYIPIGYLTPDVLASNKLRVVPNANLSFFGIISSSMHMSWIRYTTGRLKSDYQYSISIVYNNFPWPENPTVSQKKIVEQKAQTVLDVRKEFPNSTLADLYDPLTMPPKLTKAHKELDQAVDKCYRSKPFKDERERVEYLFDLYSKYTSPLIQEVEKKKWRRKK